MHPKAKARWVLSAAAVAGFSAVALGAFGAHGLQDNLKDLGTEEVWRTASTYHFIHTLALLAISVLFGLESKNFWLPRVAFFWTVGMLLFSGSLYLLALGGSKFLGPVTPLGGLALMIGWALLIPASKVHHRLEEKHELDM